MKVILTGPDFFNYTDSMAWAIRELGHQVKCLPYLGYEQTCGYIAKKS